MRLLQVAALAAAAHSFVPLQRLARPVQTSRPWALWASDGDDEAPKIVAEEAEDSGPEPGEEGYEAPKIAVAPAPAPAPKKPAEPEAPDFFGMFGKVVAGAAEAAGGLADELLKEAPAPAPKPSASARPAHGTRGGANLRVSVGNVRV